MPPFPSLGMSMRRNPKPNTTGNSFMRKQQQPFTYNEPPQRQQPFMYDGPQQRQQPFMYNGPQQRQQFMSDKSPYIMPRQMMSHPAQQYGYVPPPSTGSDFVHGLAPSAWVNPQSQPMMYGAAQFCETAGIIGACSAAGLAGTKMFYNKYGQKS